MIILLLALNAAMFAVLRRAVRRTSPDEEG